MEKISTAAGYVLGAIAIIVGATLIFVNVVYSARENRRYEVQARPLASRADPEAIARGRHLVETVAGCGACHGADLGGAVFHDDPARGRFVGPNLTSGAGGLGTSFTDADWTRALLHGVSANGLPLRVMPSQAYWNLGDDDIVAIISYLRTVPPVDRVLPNTEVKTLGRLLTVFAGFPMFPAELVLHEAPRAETVLPGETVEYGRYLTRMCVGCHGVDFAGGPIPGAPPDWPPAANLTPAADAGKWSEEAFMRALREGRRPDGAELRAPMPWKALRGLDDGEMRAIRAYLQSVPPVATAG